MLVAGGDAEHRQAVHQRRVLPLQPMPRDVRNRTRGFSWAKPRVDVFTFLLSFTHPKQYLSMNFVE